MRLHAIINGRAGSVIGIDHDQLVTRLTQALGETGHEVKVDVVDPAVLISTVAAVANTKPDAVIVGGGDGSIRAAAGVLRNGDVALGILPIGTLNRLARDLGIPVDLELAAKALADAEIRQIDVAELNGEVFLCNSLLGLPPLYSRQRQKQRGLPLMQRLVGYAAVLRQLVRSRRRVTITLDDGRERTKVRAITVAVSNNTYADHAGLIPHRPHLDRGELGIYVASHDSGLALGFAFVRAMFGYWRTDPKLTERVAQKMEIHSRKSALRVSNDGEVGIFTTPLRYRSLPQALKVLAPVETPPPTS